MKRNSSPGFSLIELMVVIGIIAILSSIIVSSLGAAKAKARDARRLADLRSIQVALATYYANNLFYPKNIYASSNAVAGSDPANGLAPAYISIVPKDPNANSTDNCSTAGNPNSLTSCYHYYGLTTASSGLCNTTNTPIVYHIGASFEDTTSSYLQQDAGATANLSNIYSTPTYYACTNSAPGSFHGDAQNCTGTTGQPTDNCYDLTP